MDRLLSNPHVHAATEAIYRSLVQWVVEPGAEVVLVVDWSDLTRDQSWQVLRAGLPVRGRTLTVLEEVHPQRNYGKARVHRAFLARLARIVPAGVRPIIVRSSR
ncbi:MAG: hypothetical protein ROZ37_15555 [Aromatoleum sp.]|jgi:hypothetical protein|uniref:hypothetical protein n=1 Tax=Aromatoleum sp. TaxID=2307007 RepID=UPI0028941760|nr:hypothetical protein [Aromatoleum sp.]MDT3671734.1 hypothetical protein [Aromatoleum sp.]